jgi:membrane-associated protein
MDLSILNEMKDYGPLAVLVLLMLPFMGEDVIIIPAGFLVGQHELPLASTFICAYLGAFFSDAVWYAICYRYGTPLLHKRWFKRLAHPRRMLQAKHQVEKRGAWVIVVARFLPGSRTSTMVVSGLMHMPVWKFLLAEGACLFLSVAMQIGVGVLIARNIPGAQSTSGKIMTIVGVIVVLIAGGFVLSWWSSHRKAGAPAPRSKATWLKRFRRPRPVVARQQIPPGKLKMDA